MAARPSSIEALLVTKAYDERGQYRVRLCIQAQWREVVVDDWFPCQGEPPKPLFTHNKHGEELWMMLIEKVYNIQCSEICTLRNEIYTLRPDTFTLNFNVTLSGLG